MADAACMVQGSALTICSHFSRGLLTALLRGSPLIRRGVAWESSTPPLGSGPSVAIVVVVLGALLPVASRVAVVVRVLAVTAVVLVRVRG